MSDLLFQALVVITLHLSGFIDGSALLTFCRRTEVVCCSDSTDSRTIYDFTLLNGWICLHGVLD